jgi:CubicO group peptidase (beta-lactamase class C family)
MILHEGAWNGSQILSKETVALISMNQVSDLLGPAGGFRLGFGMIRDTQIHPSPGSTGQLYWGGYFRTHFL